MKKIKDTWVIINEAYRNGFWFWTTVAIGVILFLGIMYLAYEYIKISLQ
jgi:hypothetical protein